MEEGLELKALVALEMEEAVQGCRRWNVAQDPAHAAWNRCRSLNIMEQLTALRQRYGKAIAARFVAARSATQIKARYAREVCQLLAPTCDAGIV